MSGRWSCSAHQGTLAAAEEEERGSLVGKEGDILQEDKNHSLEAGNEGRISRGTAEWRARLT